MGPNELRKGIAGGGEPDGSLASSADLLSVYGLRSPRGAPAPGGGCDPEARHLFCGFRRVRRDPAGCAQVVCAGVGGAAPLIELAAGGTCARDLFVEIELE